MRPALYLAFLALLSVSACRPAAAPVTVSNNPVSVNDRPIKNLPLTSSKPLEEMSWRDKDERVQKVADLKGKAVILDFWATWCGPCRDEIPHLNALLAKHGADNLQILGLNVGGEEDYPEIPKFTKETRIDYPIVFPEVALTAWVFAESDAIPQTLVLDRTGKLIERFTGFNPDIQQKLDAAVEKAVASN